MIRSGRLIALLVVLLATLPPPLTAAMDAPRAPGQERITEQAEFGSTPVFPPDPEFAPPSTLAEVGEAPETSRAQPDLAAFVYNVAVGVAVAVISTLILRAIL